MWKKLFQQSFMLTAFPAMWNPILQTSFFCMRLFIVFNIFFAISLLICGPFEVLPQVEGQKSNDIFCPVGCRCSGQSIMCRNSLRELPSLPAFIGGDTGGVIQYLGVHSSLITNIRSSAFLGQEDLVRIDLTSNRISEVASDALVGLASLRRLSLRDNHLIRLPDSVFFPVSELEELDLAENRLQTLPYSLESLARLTRLRLSNNPLHCPCHLVDFALNLGVFETAQQPVVCHSPSEVLGVPLAVLGRRLREYSNDSRYLGYSEAVPEENERSEFGGLRIHRLLVGPGKEWPWPHCPIDDFGGRPARSRLLESSTRRSEANEKDGEEGGDAVPEHQGLVMPAITKPPESVLATPGEIVQFVCQVEGQPIPKIVWRIPTNASHFIRLHQRREILEIYEVHEYHQGIYTCEVTNSLGEVSSSASLRIAQALRPRILTAPPAEANIVVEGGTLVMQCSAYGQPRPTISWIWQRGALPRNLATGGRHIVRTRIHKIGHANSGHEGASNTTISTLYIRNMTGEDAEGRYVCYASNRVGSASVTTVIRVVKRDSRRHSPVWPPSKMSHLNDKTYKQKEEESYAKVNRLQGGKEAVKEVDGKKQNTMIHAEKEKGRELPPMSVETNTLSPEVLNATSGDDFVRQVIEKARQRVEAAIKKTADRLWDPTRRRSSTDIASLFRQPSQAALELAKAAEVYEAALDEVTAALRQKTGFSFGDDRTSQLMQFGAEIGNTSSEPGLEQDRYAQTVHAMGVQLTADQLAIISQLSGCQTTLNLDACSRQLCFHLRYRSIDGQCNNLNHPRWGSALAPFYRLLPPQYENGVNTPVGWSPEKLYFGFPKPSARHVSLELLGNGTLLSKFIKRLEKEKKSALLDRQLMYEENQILKDEMKNKMIQGSMDSKLSVTKNSTQEIEALKLLAQQLGGIDLHLGDENQLRRLMQDEKLRSTEAIRLKKLHLDLLKQDLAMEAMYDEDFTRSAMVMQWGQFLDHDLDFTPVDASISRFSDGLGCNETCVNDPPCFPILVPPGDPRIRYRCIGFSRSSATCGSGSTSILLGRPHHREQLNQITAFIDASNVYGSDEFDANQLRDLVYDEGKLRVGMPTAFNKPLLPFNIRGQVDCQSNPEQDFVPCFKAGDHRSNENLGLLALHTIWLREHNRLAESLRNLNPHWSGDRIYQEARKIVAACMQAITFQAWLPHVFGRKGLERLGGSRYPGYDDQVNPTISNEFATAAMRFGHGMIPPFVFRLGPDWRQLEAGHLMLHQAFFAPDRIVSDGGIDPLLRGLLYYGIRDTSRRPPLNPELTEQLFAMAHELALDLASLNIQRGRDHGLPGYTEYAYRVCHLGNSSFPDSFDALSERIPDANIRERLRRVYGHPGNIDLFVGGILERVLPGAQVGPTFACILADQFQRLRIGDRFWYEAPGVFTTAQLAELRRAGSSLARVICDNADNITEVPKDAFLRPQGGRKDLVSCSRVPSLNLAAWKECPLAGTEVFNALGDPADLITDTGTQQSSQSRVRRSLTLAGESRDREHCTKVGSASEFNELRASVEVLQNKLLSLERKINLPYFDRNAL